jgi:hypothetical protein
VREARRVLDAICECDNQCLFLSKDIWREDIVESHSCIDFWLYRV